MAWAANGRWIDDYPQNQGPLVNGLLNPAANDPGGNAPPGTIAPPAPVVPPVMPVQPPAPVIVPDVTPLIPAVTPPAIIPAATPGAVLPPATTLPTTTTTTPPAVVPPPSAIPIPTAPVLPAPYVMPAAPTPVDASVATQLTGLLASDSPYLALARNAGMRTAGRRGLVNSSIAAGSAEAAAIAAAAPIASQDASQLHATNQTNLEGWTSLRNATALEQMQENARVWAQQDQNIQQILLNNSTNSSAMERLLKQGDIESAIALMREDKALTQTQINANVSLLGNYMNAFAELSKNENIPSDVRDAYLREFQRVTGSGQSLVNALSGMTPRGGTGGTGGTGGSISTGNGTSFNPSSTPFTTAPKNPWTGPTPSQILAMYNDGKKGGYGYASAEEAGAAYNAWASANGVKQLDLPAAAPKKKSGLLGALISPLGKAIGLI